MISIQRYQLFPFLSHLYWFIGSISNGRKIAYTPVKKEKCFAQIPSLVNIWMIAILVADIKQIHNNFLE